MNADELKLELKKIFGNQIIFNKEFDDISKNIKNIDSNLIEWCKLVKDDKIKRIPSNLTDNVVFINKIGSTNRCIIIKMKNGEFIEIHLGNHKYYDYLRKKLGLKKDNKSY